MKKLMCRIFLLFIAALLLMTLPGEIRAAEITASGTFGDNISWVLTDDGTLTLSGTGAIPAEGVATTPWYEYREQVTTVIIGDGITDTGSATFANYHQLEKAVIGDDVTVIGESLFYYCWNLTEVELGKSVKSIEGSAFLNTAIKQIVLPEGVTSIESYAFDSCGSLESITIPSSVTTIGESAFSGCFSLETVVLPDSVTTIGESAFSSCVSLETVVLPDSVTTIGERCFEDSGLTSIALSEGLTAIPYAAFKNCDKLTDIFIPVSVTAIDNRAFYDCNVANIWYGGTQEQWKAMNVDRTFSSGLYMSFVHYESVNPKTGDPLTVVLPMLLLSGCATVLMLTKKRQ